jgi:hypothetical protein
MVPRVWGPATHPTMVSLWMERLAEGCTAVREGLDIICDHNRTNSREADG